MDDTGRVTAAVAVLSDISKERAEEQQRADFISTASHEMRTPVAAIEGYLALALNEKVATIDSRAREYLEKARNSTQHLGQLFQDLLTSAKAEDGRLTSHPQLLELGEFLEQLSNDLRLVAEKKGLQMDFTSTGSNTINATTAAAGERVIRPLYYVNVDPEVLPR
jgi:signal transduction histidine kinase